MLLVKLHAKNFELIHVTEACNFGLLEQFSVVLSQTASLFVFASIFSGSLSSPFMQNG